MTNFAKVRDSACNAIKRYLQASQSNDNSFDREIIQSHLLLLDEQWKRFGLAQESVEISCGVELIATEEEARLQAESWYLLALSNFHRLLNAMEQPNITSSRTASKDKIRLPQIELPSFAGDPTEWIAFRDMFKTLVHSNETLSESQKLHYLRSCLKGEALSVIRNFQLSDANYKEAWEMINSRFQVMRVIVDHHLMAIFSVKKAISDSAHDIKQVLDLVVQHTRALKALGRPVEFWDDWLVHIIVSKLAYETRKHWELSLLNDQLPTLEELLTFLRTRCRSLEMLASAGAVTPNINKNVHRKSANVLHSVKGNQPPVAPKSENTVTESSYCLCCNQGHKIYACTAFLSLVTSARALLIKDKKACWNCLSTGHLATKCRSLTNCRICHLRHHTLLHRFTNSPADQMNTSASLEVAQPHVHHVSAFNDYVHAASRTTIADSDEVPKKDTTANYDALYEAPSSSSATTRSSIASDVHLSPPAYNKSINTAVDIAETTSHHADTERAILLATAAIFVRDNAERWQPARVLFDNGSHASFITESCMQRLCLRRKPSSIRVTGIAASQGGVVKGEASLCLSPRALNCSFEIKALILSKITNDLPTVNVRAVAWPHLQALSLADPCYAKPAPIDLLIGMDEMDKFLQPGFHKGPPGTPMAQQTAFGWVLFGNAPTMESVTTTISTMHCDVQLMRAVSKFWEQEELPKRKYLTPEENFCEQHFNETHARSADGRFVVRLPLKRSVPLGESRTNAIRSLFRLERKFAANETLRTRYSEFMQELLSMGHMEPTHNMPKECYYMPHHAVLKDTSTTTKLRVVFNASMNTSSGHSLNDALMVGPQLQQDLFSILVRFRTHRYAMTADVEKMYRQVHVNKSDVDFQRIVWRNSPLDSIQDYRMLRVTYGVAAASHLAVKSLQQTAKYATKDQKEAAGVIIRDFYMDDLLTGSWSIENLSVLQKDISHILSQGCFPLRKWATNCRELASNIPHDSKSISHILADDFEVRTLGIVWNTDGDFLTISVRLKEIPVSITKRIFLSDASMLFDPLGLISPCTIRSKIWLQQIWRADVDWDEQVPANIRKDWFAHRLELPKLSSLKLSRWIGTNQTADNTEFHIFTDASERAYAAAVYSRSIKEDGTIKVTLIAARAKVAPLKSTSLPRLELCAAHLGAKIVKQVLDSFNFSPSMLYAWTDSTVTLSWLQGHPSRWSTYVANRVAEVQEVLPPACWRHVRSEHNPADCASRGVSPSQLLNHQLWWHGPQWLLTSERDWQHKTSSQHTTDLELRKKVTIAHTASSEKCWDFLAKYSSYSKLKRIAAYLRRFSHNLRNATQERKIGPLTISEIREAEIALVKYVQSTAFSNEIYLCRLNKPIPLRSNLLRLQPFLDAYGTLRVAGRIRNADIAFAAKHPIILPKDSPLVKVIIAEIHELTLHAGPHMMQAVLHRRFWIPASRSIVRKFYRNCVKCKRLNRQPMQQIMADLPLSRVTSARCFLRSAVDFAGPFSLKFSPGRGSKSTKGYVCSFVCMSTGAMHLELVGDLSTVAFLSAFKRFINRRGYCQHVFSDNGTNFVGADKELRNTFELCMADQRVRHYFEDSHITWHFNPPSAPHMGGYWETGIKRVKYHLKRVLTDTLLTYEEFNTLLTEVEACVNSRPICSNSTNAFDSETLTPGHFITGEPLKSLPESNVQPFSGTLGQRWNVIIAMRQHFWKRWRSEYLIGLQHRMKWFRPSISLKTDDIVVVHDERVPPTKWKLGRVIECYPGQDGQVRVVRLKTLEGELLRPVVKLTFLPTQNDIFA